MADGGEAGLAHVDMTSVLLGPIGDMDDLLAPAAVF